MVYQGHPRAEVVELGVVTAEPVPGPDATLDYTGVVLGHPIARADLVTAGITAAEFQRAPQAPNPSFFTSAEFGVLKSLVPEPVLRDLAWGRDAVPLDSATPR